MSLITICYSIIFVILRWILGQDNISLQLENCINAVKVLEGTYDKQIMSR